jgi:hypothetical protein
LSARHPQQQGLRAVRITDDAENQRGEALPSPFSAAMVSSPGSGVGERSRDLSADLFTRSGSREDVGPTGAAEGSGGRHRRSSGLPLRHRLASRPWATPSVSTDIPELARRGPPSPSVRSAVNRKPSQLEERSFRWGGTETYANSQVVFPQTLGSSTNKRVFTRKVMFGELRRFLRIW